MKKKSTVEYSIVKLLRINYDVEFYILLKQVIHR